MGVYWRWVNPKRREVVQPHSLDESLKWPFGPKVIEALAELMMYGDWRDDPVMLVCDSETGGLYDQAHDWIEAEPWRDRGPEAYRQAKAKS